MKVESVLMRWSKLGIIFNVASADSTPDIERLLVNTAIVLPEQSRLFSVVISWLYRNYRLVCRHRLSGFAEQISSSETSAVLGLVLDIVKRHVK